MRHFIPIPLNTQKRMLMRSSAISNNEKRVSISLTDSYAYLLKTSKAQEKRGECHISLFDTRQLLKFEKVFNFHRPGATFSMH